MKVSSFAKYLGAVAIVVGLFTGCSALFTIELSTTVRVDNTAGYTVSIGASSYDVAQMDFYGTTVGDVYFGTVYNGEQTNYRTISSSGYVDVNIDSAIAILTDGTKKIFRNIYKSYNIVSGTSNTVIFTNCSASSQSNYNDNITQVRIKNEMVELDIKVGAITYSVDYIDLYGIAVDNLFFSSVKAGTTSPYKTYSSYGNVNIDVDSVKAWLSDGTVKRFYDIALAATITPYVLNEIVFDAYEAGVIFSTPMYKRTPIN